MLPIKISPFGKKIASPHNEKWWLCFTAQQDGSTIGMAKVGSPPALTMETSIDEGETWVPFTIGVTTITLLNIGDKVYFRAGEAGNAATASAAGIYNKFTATGKVAASGNINSILNGRTHIYSLTNNFALCQIFRDCTALISAPEFPAISLSESCYRNALRGCTSLTSAPELPAMTLADSCYHFMFYGCTSLTSAPELPAMTLADYCYTSMFYGCTRLTSAPELPAITLADSCYESMFESCIRLTSAPELPAITLADSCYESMFYGCTSLTSAPELPAMTVPKEAYRGMFYTTKIESITILAEELGRSSMDAMLSDCSKLTSITVKFNQWYPDLDSTWQWVFSVSSSGVFYCPSSLGTQSTITRGVSNCPSGWTVANI